MSKKLTPLDKIEMEQVKKKVYSNFPSGYRGFIVQMSNSRNYVAWRDNYYFETPHLQSLLNIIFLITKE